MAIGRSGRHQVFVSLSSDCNMREETEEEHPQRSRPSREGQGHLPMAMAGQTPQTGHDGAQTVRNRKSMHVVKKQWFRVCASPKCMSQPGRVRS